MVPVVSKPNGALSSHGSFIAAQLLYLLHSEDETKNGSRRAFQYYSYEFLHTMGLCKERLADIIHSF